MTYKFKIYIASPYTKPEGKQLENTLRSFEIFNELAKLGFIPFAPLTSHFIHEHYPQNYEFWLDYDIHWLLRCDAVLRLPGESNGADKEVSAARINGIPVFYDIKDLVEWRDNYNADPFEMLKNDGSEC